MSSYPFIEVEQGKRSFLLTALPAELVAKISYAAVRRVDNEEGAVQRILNQNRISGIAEFAKSHSSFPASIVLNWVGSSLAKRDGKISILGKPHSAQIIDGQHRLAGLTEAMKTVATLKALMLPVAIYEGLDTKGCAELFLSINTEQRPAPKSLVYDLFGEVGDELVDQAAARAKDIAMHLNDNGEPYEGRIKLPNAARQKGGIQLSTAVATFKPLVEEKSLLEQIDISSLEMQKIVFSNFFKAIEVKYGDRWEERDNAFMYAAGFIGAIDFFQHKMLPYCNLKKSFKIRLMADSLDLGPGNLILQPEVKGLGGKDAPKRVFDRLVEVFKPQAKDAKFSM